VSISKKKLRRQYGMTDVEHLAMALYGTFHDDDHASLCRPYKKHESDAVVQQFRRYALVVAKMAQHDADYHGMGSALYEERT
jgi:hypothetical protein